MRFDFDITSFDNNSCNFFDDPANEFRYYVVRRHGVLDGKRGQIQLETGPEQYRFYYWSMKVGEHPVPLDQAFDEETKILTIDTSPLDSNNYGIVFQSLKGVAPRHYFRPIYKGEPPKYTNRKERYLWCFNVASAHCIPFQVFRCLKEVVTPTVLHPVGKLNEFFVEYMKVRNWKPSAQDYKDLHRFAYEFLFDWIMIPRKYWRSRSENSGMLRDGEDRSIGFSNQICREVLTRLFRTSPYNKREEREYLEKILEFYWDLPNDPIEWTFTRSSKPGNILVQHMRGRQGDKEFLDEDYESRLKLLRDLHKCNTLFEDAFRIMIQMQEKIQ